MKYLRFTSIFIALTLCLTFVAENYAATFTVTNTNDSGSGSLRQALEDANSNNENDNIVFDSGVFSTPQTIDLTTGPLIIGSDDSTGGTKTLTIEGPGANLLTINGDNQTRVIRVLWKSIATIDGITISQGDGGIYVEGGFGISQPQNLVIKNSIISDNHVQVLSNTGGGIYLFGNVTIINSAIVNNTSAFYGGGIASSNNSYLRIVNSTISDNTAAGLGGGIRTSNGRTFLTNCTVAFNKTTNEFSGGDGIHLTTGGQFGIVNLYSRNSIIAKNSAGSEFDNDVTGSFIISEGYNIFGEVGAITGDTTGDQTDTDPKLDVNLSANGGIIPSHALRADSPAIDAGDNCVLETPENGGCLEPNITTDQRGISRPQDGDGDETATVDIGAFEVTREEVLNAPSSAPDLQSTDDSGMSDSDNITSDSTLSFDLAGVTDGATVELLRNGVVVDSTTANGSSVMLSDNEATVNGTFVYTSRQIINNVPSLQGPSLEVKIDNEKPTVTVNQTTEQADPTNTQPINFNVNFSEEIIGFNAATDFSLQNSTVDVSSAIIAIYGEGPDYVITVRNVFGDGQLVVDILPDAVSDIAGNNSLASTSDDNTVTLDMTPPTVSINQAATQSDPTRSLPVNFTVVFSEPVTGFNNADVSLAGSTANVSSASINVTGSGTTYNVAVSGISSNGSFVKASIRNQAAVDAAGNTSLSSTSTDNEVVIDNVSPTVTINQAVDQIDPTNTLPANFTVIFSEEVTGFDASDISLSGSTLNTSGASINVTGSGTTYNISVGNVTSNGGRVRASVRSGAASDSVGNFSFASTSTDNSVTIDNIAPTVSINQSIGQPDPTSVQPIKFTVVFNELVTGFSAEDISLNGSTANVALANIEVSGSGSVYTVNISNITSSGQVKASVLVNAAQDSTGNPSSASNSTDNMILVNIVKARFDMDGDGKTDIGIFRPDVGQWWYLRSIDNVAKAFEFGQSSDVIVPADFTGDGATDIAFWRPSTGQWFVLRSEDNSFFAFDFGTNGDIPVPGDFDGDGKADAAVFRPSSSTWFILKSLDSTVLIQQFGLNGDKPIVEDYDGDGKVDLAVYRPSESQWFYQRSSDLVVKGFEFGTPGDTKPAPADFTGDGKADIAFFKPSATSGADNWFVLRSEDNSFFAFPFGVSTDIPVPGDYDGDGKADPAVFRPTNFTWYLERSTAGFTAIQFGVENDKPLPTAYIP